MTLRWGFLGASRIGRRALAPALTTAGHHLVAVAARERDRARAFADTTGATNAYGSYAELIDDPMVEAVYNALPNDGHLLWTLRALAAGKHVLCEKPLALSPAEVAQMQLSQQQSGNLVMEAFCPPFHPQFDRALHAVRNGDIGRLVAMHGWFVNPVTDTTDFRWAPSLGGGALFDLGGYCVSAMRWMSGKKLLRVAATQHTLRGVDASFSGALTFADDVSGQFTCSFEAARNQRLVLLGTDGQISLDAPYSCKDRITTLEINGRAEQFQPTDPYARMVTHFGDAVAGRVPMLHGLDDSLIQAQVLEALFSAAGSGVAVSL